MITTYDEAKKIILRTYGEDFKLIVRSDKATIGVRPIYEQRAGFPTLAWQRVSRGRDSAVRLGLVIDGGTEIDWQWDSTEPAESRIPPAEVIKAQAERIRNLISLKVRFRRVLQELYTAPMLVPRCDCGVGDKMTVLGDHAPDCDRRRLMERWNAAGELLSDTA